ncbi:hypothetical protein LSAT2_015215 [Lamellibrachia satsuma]|nr:hypothetical protein LSAT2_015215 [Lamellibrachia satsuma]
MKSALIVVAVVILTRLARAISEEDALIKLIDCQRDSMKTFDECSKDLPHLWKMCHDLYVWSYNYCKRMFFNRIKT